MIESLRLDMRTGWRRPLFDGADTWQKKHQRAIAAGESTAGEPAMRVAPPIGATLMPIKPDDGRSSSPIVWQSGYRRRVGLAGSRRSSAGYASASEKLTGGSCKRPRLAGR